MTRTSKFFRLNAFALRNITLSISIRLVLSVVHLKKGRINRTNRQRSKFRNDQSPVTTPTDEIMNHIAEIYVLGFTTAYSGSTGEGSNRWVTSNRLHGSPSVATFSGGTGR